VRDRVAVLEGGETLPYQALVPTLPLPLLVQMLDEVPEDIR
jgi:hypothetical protein